MTCKIAATLIEMIEQINREEWEKVKKFIDDNFDEIKKNHEKRREASNCYYRVLYTLRELNSNKYKEENLND